MNTGTLDCYVPRVLLKRLVTAPDEAVQTLEASVVFVDLSGFTRLSERLSRRGKEGAEHLVDAINSCFTALLAEAYGNGGALLKFGGDALLLWFEGEGHAVRACSSAVAMRSTLRRVGRIDTGASQVVLRMSVGIHSGQFETFLVGDSHREYLIAGPAASSVVEMEGAASAGQILVSRETANLLPASCLGAASGPGVLLTRAPAVRPTIPSEQVFRPSDEEVAACLSTAVRAHVAAATGVPEHRNATVSFLQFGELDELIAREGAESAARAVEEVVVAAQEAADRYEVCFLGSDVAADGGKLLFSAGAPRVVGDDEERMLLAMRHAVTASSRLPVRAGVNRGHVFTGDVGPPYRRTYAVMGDAVNLAARLMAKAPWEKVYSTPAVLERSHTSFEATSVPPFTVKGKIRPVQASEVGPAIRAAVPASPQKRLPLIGRQKELDAIREAIASARSGQGGRLIEIVGETGTGKSRLLTEARELAGDMGFVHTTCETYTRDIPYIGWRDPLRQLIGMGWEDPDDLVLDRLRERVQSTQPELLPWLPLLAIPLGCEAPSTREVEELAPEYRTAKLHEVVQWFLAPALAVPTLVQIEHAHLMDEASAALGTALARPLTFSSWVVIVTRRDDESGFVAPEEPSIKLELGPLSPQSLLELAEATPEAHVIPPHVLELAIERSGGSPEFLLDLLSAAAGGSGTLPDSVEAAAGARIDALDPSDRALVRRAAVLGLAFHSGRVRDVLEPEAPEPDEQTWRRLAGVFARDPDGHVRFKRPALCEVAYESLPFRLRRQLHAAVARSLETDLGRDIDADPAILSRHFELASDHSRAWTYALMGAERATARFAHADASRLYRRAIDSGKANGAEPRDLASVYERLGDALGQVGEVAAAADAYTSARRLLAGDPIVEARLYFRHGQLCQRTQMRSAVRWMRRALRTLEDVPGREAQGWRARLTAELAWIHKRQRRYRDTERLCREAMKAGRAVGELRAEARACYTLDLALFELGRPDEAIYSQRALDIYRQLGDHENEGNVLNNLGIFAYWQGRWQEAIDLYQEAAACAERAGNASDVADADGNVGEILSDQGRFEEANEHLRRARRVRSSTGHQEGAAFVNMALGRLAVRTGEAEQGIPLLEATAAQMRQVGIDYYADFADAYAAEGEALGGSAERAIELTARLLGSANPNVSLLRRASGIALARIGEWEAARRELALAIDSARAASDQYELAVSLDVLGALGSLDAAGRRERDAILERLGVVRLPALPELTVPDGGGQPLAAFAASG